MDPPRKGLDSSVVNLICTKKPIYIAYLSCNPTTLARDLNLFLNLGGYHLEKIIPYDFFPQTTHLETLVFLKLLTA